MTAPPTAGFLAGCRVLDLTGHAGAFCARLLADLGADVIKIEPPAGDPGRRLGPFRDGAPGAPDAERSLTWTFLNTAKRGVTLNLGVPSGRALLRRLAARADVLVESFPPGSMEGMGLGYSTLVGDNPRLVYTAITPFGQTGPYAQFKAPDLVLEAMAGHVYVLGDPDRPPVRISFPQSHAVAGAQAAVGTLIAYYHRLRTGRGQFVDVSGQQAVIWVLQDVHLFWDLTRSNVRRSGANRRRPDTGVMFPFVWQCRDGHLCFAIIGGCFGARSLRALTDWMEEADASDDYLRGIDWMRFDWRVVSQADLDPIVARFSAFFRRFSMQELMEQAVKRRIMLYPAFTSREILEDPQLRARGFWRTVDDPWSGTMTFPGPPFRLDGRMVALRTPAPALGQHNAEVYGELELGAEELAALRGSGAV
ncbi:MAG: CaiB/BaiF CoA transferase family protein [Candidatus Rokuibacteriota bacterium]